MKRKRKEPTKEIKVLAPFLYSVDGNTVLTSVEGEELVLPSWMAKNFVNLGKATFDLEEDIDDDFDDDEDDDESEYGEGYTKDELKELTETDFEDLNTTAKLDAWATKHLKFNIPNHYKPETALKKIMKKIAEL